MTRDHIIDAFLVQAGWLNATRIPLAGDASFRSYERVHDGERRAILMNAPPDKEDIRPFCHIQTVLRAHGFSAPECYAKDEVQGLMLLEDLGDGLYGRLLAADAAQEHTLYHAAMRTLMHIQDSITAPFPPCLSLYDHQILLRECALFAEWYVPTLLADEDAIRKAQQSFTVLWQQLLQARLPESGTALEPVIVLRDFHADNLLWLPQREGTKSVGLLDFQDALLGSPAYDVVSFLEDARRDVSATTVDSMLNLAQENSSWDTAQFRLEYALLGAQRNCKIIGIFSRLHIRDGKQQYLKLLPRVWGHLLRNIRHPALNPLAVWIETWIPEEVRHVPAQHPMARQGA